MAFEQSLDIQSRILDEGTDIMYGEDTTAFDDAVDNGVVVSADGWEGWESTSRRGSIVEGPAKVKLLKVRPPLHLDSHQVKKIKDQMLYQSVRQQVRIRKE